MKEKIESFFALISSLLLQYLPPQQEVVLAGGKKTIVLRDGYKPHVIDVRKVAARMHRLTDLGDLLAYAQRAAKPAEAALFCAAGRFVLVLDDFDEPGREQVTYVPTLTQQAREWLGADGKGKALSFNHVKLKKFIEDHERDIVESGGLFGAVAQFSAKTEMVYQANLGKSGNKNIGFQIKTGQIEGTVELPTELAIEILLFEGWAGRYAFEVRLDWEQIGDAPIFSLEPANVQAVVEQAIAEMVDHAKAMLGEGWMVVRGTPCIEANQGK